MEISILIDLTIPELLGIGGLILILRIAWNFGGKE